MAIKDVISFNNLDILEIHDSVKTPNLYLKLMISLKSKKSLTTSKQRK